MKNIFFKLFVSSFGVLYIGGLFLHFLIKTLGFDKGFNSAVFLQACLFFLVFYLSYRTVRMFGWHLSKSHHSVGYATANRGSRISLLASVASIALYISANGLVLIGSSDYSSRYESNAGFGFLTLLMLYFYIHIAIEVFLWMKGQRQLHYFFWIKLVAFVLVTFVALGGHRQLGLGVVVGVILCMVVLGIYKTKHVFLWSIIFLLGVTFGAFVRYGEGVGGVGDFFGMGLIYLYDSVSPVNAHVDILEYTRGRAVFPDLIYNQFATYVPRFFWPGKPIQVMNGGNYYTSYILGLSEFITYSPTLIGELLLAHGSWYWIGAVFSGVILGFLDKIVKELNIFSISLIVYSPILVFNLYREGFYVFFSRLVIYTLMLYILLLVSRLRRVSYAD